MLRTQLPDDWIDVISTSPRSSMMSGASSSLIQLYWMFWRVVKWPKPRVVLARDVRELAHLRRRQRAVRHVHAQHVRMQLEVQAVHQPQRPELVLGDLAREAALHLAAKLRGALGDELLVELVVSVHRLPLSLRCSC